MPHLRRKRVKRIRQRASLIFRNRRSSVASKPLTALIAQGEPLLRLALALAFAIALVAPADAATNPKPTKSPTPDIVAEVATLNANYTQITRLFQRFAVSVYKPYCANH